MVGPCSEGLEEKPSNCETPDQKDKGLGCWVSEGEDEDAVCDQVPG